MKLRTIKANTFADLDAKLALIREASLAGHTEDECIAMAEEAYPYDPTAPVENRPRDLPVVTEAQADCHWKTRLT